MFEKPMTARQEEEIVSGAPKSSRYAQILEEAYLHGGLPHLPELEVFGVGEVDIGRYPKIGAPFLKSFDNTRVAA